MLTAVRFPIVHPIFKSLLDFSLQGLQAARQFSNHDTAEFLGFSFFSFVRSISDLRLIAGLAGVAQNMV